METWHAKKAVRRGSRCSGTKKALIDAVPDKSAGRALKAIFSYFEDGKLPDDLEPLEFAVFSAVKPYVDDAYKDYARSVEAGRNGANTRWSK